MDNVNKTLYIPLYGKAAVSRKGIILKDPKAEEIWAAEGFPLKGKSRSKWLAYYMGMRSAVFDSWLRQQMATHGDAVILHVGCGMDSRVERIGTKGHLWYDVDFPEVVAERMGYFEETVEYHMVKADVREPGWLEPLPAGDAIVLMEGVSMYLRPEEAQSLLRRLRGHFTRVHVLMDCYTTFAARASKYKNPIHDVGVTTVYGVDDPAALAEGTGLAFLQEHEMTPETLIHELRGVERALFRKLFAGGISRKMYRLYEFGSK